MYLRQPSSLSCAGSWGRPTSTLRRPGGCQKDFERRLFTVCLRQEARLFGLARVVGDGALYFYVSDVIVRPELRGSGYGVLLMKAVLGYLRRAAHPGAMIVVVPLNGRESFYERFGFKRCSHGRFGVGMYLPKQIEAGGRG
jgi:GNAT superfamily N-acetyltransferase